MTTNRIKISSIIENQLPEFIRIEFPLISQFLSEYYNSIDGQGLPNDLLANVDKYIKLDFLSSVPNSTLLTADVSVLDDEISVSSTIGFPDEYGLIKIDDEIILYKSKTDTKFTQCVRGFSGLDAEDFNKDNLLVFEKTLVSDHSNSSEVVNISGLFLKIFLEKVKTQISPGFQNRDLYSELNQNLFLKHSVGFYSSKGSDGSFEILFRALYGEEVKVIKPRDYIFESSTAKYRITKDLIVESIEGNIFELKNRTIFQDIDEINGFSYASAPVSDVQIMEQGNDTYFILKLDFDFDKDIEVSGGSLIGEFSIHPKTVCIEYANTDSDTITVDSTLGFPESGEIYYESEFGGNVLVKYTSKNYNQFLGCTGITEPIKENAKLKINSFAYGYLNISKDEKITFRVSSIASEIKIPKLNYLYEVNDTIEIETLGKIIPENIVDLNLFYNQPISYNVEKIDIVSSFFKITTIDENNISIGDKIKLILTNNREYEFEVLDIENKNSFFISLDLSLSSFIENDLLYIKKSINKLNATNYPNSSINLTGIQNTFYDDDDNFYITSSSLPNYQTDVGNPEITFSGQIGSNLISIPNHNFLNGDYIQYIAGEGPNNVLSCPPGFYYVRRIDSSTIQLASSKANLYLQKYVTINSDNSSYETVDPTTGETITVAGQILDNKIILQRYSQEELTSQRIIRKLVPPVNTDKSYPIQNNSNVGILNNGVEISHYTSQDSIFFGKIEKIFVTSGGSNYDVINPPSLIISDINGFDGSAICEVEGHLERIDIIDAGFDFYIKPEIKITGGNGKDALAEVNLAVVENILTFNSSSNVNVNISDNIIGFSTYHRFLLGEKIIYDTQKQLGVGGLSSDRSYFVSLVNDFSIKLHETYSDSVSGINTVNLTSYGLGVHKIKSFKNKNKIGSILIKNRGYGYKSKRITVNNLDVDVANDSFYAKNHSYKDKEVIVYKANGDAVGGLVNNKKYYVKSIDSDNFRLFEIGIGVTNQTYYYDLNQYVEILSKGTGVHQFDYEPIEIEVTGISSTSRIPVLQPIFRGEIKNVFVTNGGGGYGTVDIINYQRQPSFEVVTGSNAELEPIILEGKIQAVLVKNSGKNYFSPPDLVVHGDGTGCVLTPILRDGKIISVVINSSGIGYSKNKTFIAVVPSGSGANFEAKITEWKINEVERLLYQKLVVDDDGYIKSSKYGIQYTHLYAPRKLRRISYGSKYVAGKLTYQKDLVIDVDDNETDSDRHSPILGYAYDGNPIYGPYGYVNPDGSGGIKCLESSYKQLNTYDSNRPPFFPGGFFVNDFYYNGSGDLDEHNGRFCVTPEYPNGVYAYFMTINPTSVELDPSSPFRRFKKPQFPYVIGETFKSVPIQFNFDYDSYQPLYDPISNGLIKNTNNYGFTKENTFYEFIDNPAESYRKQVGRVNSSSLGEITGFEILDSGQNYKCGDKILISIDENSDPIESISIKEIKGKDVTKVEYETLKLNDISLYPITKNSFIGFANSSHNLKSNDYLNFVGLSTDIQYQIGSKTIFPIKVKNSSYILQNDLSNSFTTGKVTYIKVSGDLRFPNLFVDDILIIDEEKVRVLEVDAKNSYLKIERGYDGTIGFAHTSSTVIIEDPRKFVVDFEIEYFDPIKLNRNIYFDPQSTVSIGLTSGIGIGNTLPIPNVSVGNTEIFVPTKTIYIRNHSLETGDKLIYNSNNSGDPIRISINGSSSFDLVDDQVLYVVKINEDFIGISTSKIAVGSGGTYVSVGSSIPSPNTVYFQSSGTGNNHKFSTSFENSSIVSCERSNLVVSTAQTHGLSVSDKISLRVDPTLTKDYKVVYDDTNRRLLINPVSFASTSTDVINNTIFIPNHDFNTGDKVICNTDSPILPGYQNSGIYYVVYIDINTVKLSQHYYQSILETPQTISFNSSFEGTISKINPRIEVFENSTITFDLSDSSLSSDYFGSKISAFDFKVFYDDKRETEFLTSSNTNKFAVIKSGIVGVSSESKLELKTDDSTPINLYYRLVPVNIDLLPLSKSEYIEDRDNIIDSSKILIKDSLYNGTYTVSELTSNTFKSPISFIPEEIEYTNQNSKLSYTTNSKTAVGEISGFLLNSFKKYYNKIPVVNSIKTATGYGAFLLPLTKNIGTINDLKIENVGFEYPSDISLRPTCIFPQILLIQPLFKIDTIEIIYEGSGYTTNHDLIVIDDYDNTLNRKIKLEYDPINLKVNIIENEQSLKGSKPKIIPINNTNGVGISSATYNNQNQKVTLQLSTAYSSIQDFPFSVGDKILVENIINDGDNGFNSSDYGYDLFTIEDIDPNIGGYLPTISYSLSKYLDIFDSVGEYLNQLSFGRVINEKDLPNFLVKIDYIDFKSGEEIKDNTGKIIGETINWNKKNRILKTFSKIVIPSEIEIYGNSSGAIANILRNEYQKSEFILGSSSIVNNNWVDEIGFLNNNDQRLHDNNYYQYFSYAINSAVSYTEWKEPVKSLVHPSGFKEFSEINIESQPSIDTGNCNLVSGICTDQNNGYFEGQSDLVSVIDLDCYPDFDLAREVTYDISNNYVSNEIVFNSRILQDYFESIGNRVLEIQIPDDVSQAVGGDVRISLLDQFDAKIKKYKKYIAYSQFNDEENNKQISLLSVGHDGNESYINEYAILTNQNEILGTYDLDINFDIAILKFIPSDSVNYSQNDFTSTVISYDINSNISGISTLLLGDVVKIEGFYDLVPSGTSSNRNIISIPKSEIRSGKILVGLSSEQNNFFQLNELTFLTNDYISSTILDPIDVSLLDYGKIVLSNTNPNGIGTYTAYYDDVNQTINIDFIPDSTTTFDFDVNSSAVIFSDYNKVSSGTTSINTGKFTSFYNTIPSSPFNEFTVADYDNEYQFGAYAIVTIENKSTNEHQVSELIVLTDPENDEASISEYGSVFVDDRLGYFTAEVSGTKTLIKFTPTILATLEFRVLVSSIGVPIPSESDNQEINLGNISLSGSNVYAGGYTITLNRSFELYNDFQPIFRRTFDASDPRIVSIASSSVYLYNHNFSTGEKIHYYYDETNQPIGIKTTNIPGIGFTDKLPSELYAVKINKSQISLSATPEDALKPIPSVLSINSLGIGISHTFLSDKQNEKCLITIDNWIQSPISRTDYFTYCDGNINETQNLIRLTGIGSIFTGDLIKIDDEFLLIDDVGVGTDLNLCVVRRDWLNTGIQTHNSNSEVRKYSGNYNIHKNILTFAGEPISGVPVETDDPDELDYTGIQTSSSFYGRVFLRSGRVGSSSTTYKENYVFDDISSQFKFLKDNFLLKSNTNNVEDIEDFNGGIVLIKDVYQIPQRLGTPDIEGSYYFGGTGISTVYFTGSINSQLYDINSFSLPVGGVIQSVSSFAGSGYQPLVCAGGTAVVNTSGVLQSISIGSSGSGYRENVQQVVNVGIITGTNLEEPEIIRVGFANISGGYIYSATITTPVSNLDQNNPPIVVIDEPLPYANIPLIYSSSSPINGIGTQATVDIVVSQDGSVIDFEIKNYGYSYDNLEILTLPINDGYGIPTGANFSEFKLTLDRVYNDKFSGWTMGEFAPLDYIDNLFNGQRTSFPLSIDSQIYPIIAREGSSIDLKMTLLVFVNNILQRPDVGYKFEGGSYITFSEAPKKGDRCEIIFYKGTPGIDVIFNDIIETIEPGDNVTLNSDDVVYREDSRLVLDLRSIDSVITNPYSGAGISSNFDLERPVVWCKQRNDYILTDSYLTKDRAIYEPLINPSANLIAPVGVGSTHIFVDSLLPFFENEKESVSLEKSRSIEIISKAEIRGAQANALLNNSGILTGFNITDGGYGYSYPPLVEVQVPVGIAVTFIPILQSQIDDNGTVVSINVIQSPIQFGQIPSVTIEFPNVLYERIDEVSYQGDYGKVVGIASTSLPKAPTGLILQLEIPSDSLLRDKSYTGFAATASTLEKDFYFKIFNSNIGNGLSSLDENGNIVCKGQNYMDNIYKVIETYNFENIIQVNTTITNFVDYPSPTAIEDTYSLTIDVNGEVTIQEYDNLEVLVSVENYGSLISDIFSATSPTYFGDYSWGRIVATERIKERNFVVGFPTSFSEFNNIPTVRRTNPLSYRLYNP